MTKKATILSIIIVVSAALIFGIIYLAGKSGKEESAPVLFDREAFDVLDEETSEALSGADSNEEVAEYLENWASVNGLVYTTDDHGNVIFTKNASDGCEDMPMTVICTDYNYQLLGGMDAITTLQYIAKYTDISGPLAVIFFENSLCRGRGIRNISRSYFPDGANVIYLTSGNSMRVSHAGFAKATSIVEVPAEKVGRTCDTGIRIRITGLPAGAIGRDIEDYPDPIDQLRAILSRMSDKSMTFELAEVSIDPNGNMHPLSMEAVILVNSYSVESMTKYLDRQISTFTDEYGDYPDISYTYELIDDIEELPDQVYSSKTAEIFTNFIYTAKYGTYLKNENSEIPEALKESEIYGFNMYKGVSAEDDVISIYMYSAAVDDEYLKTILKDNETAAEFTGASVDEVSKTPAFTGDEEMAAELSLLYSTANDTTTTINIINDSDFVPVSYLYETGRDLNIVSVTVSKRTNARITNTLLHYLTYSHVEDEENDEN